MLRNNFKRDSFRGRPRLYGPGGWKLKAVGALTDKLSYKGKSFIERIYVVRDQQVSLLSKPASMGLKLVARIDMINQEIVKQAYPKLKLCDGLGLTLKPYNITPKPDAKLFTFKVPVHVPQPLKSNR